MTLQPITSTSPAIISMKKSKLTDKFYTNIKNTSDMTDTVSVPRTVFKGYLGFMSGSFLGAISQIVGAKKPSKLSKGLNIAGIGLMIYGTFAFVRPYIFKDIKGVTK